MIQIHVRKKEVISRKLLRKNTNSQPSNQSTSCKYNSNTNENPLDKIMKSIHLIQVYTSVWIEYWPRKMQTNYLNTIHYILYIQGTVYSRQLNIAITQYTRTGLDSTSIYIWIDTLVLHTTRCSWLLKPVSKVASDNHISQYFSSTIYSRLSVVKGFHASVI